jgi:WD40 repeat protein
VLLAELSGRGRVKSVAVTADNTRIITGSDDNTARVWNIFPSGQNLVDEAKRKVPRCLSPDQREAHHLARAAPIWCENMCKWSYDVGVVARSN